MGHADNLNVDIFKLHEGFGLIFWETQPKLFTELPTFSILLPRLLDGSLVLCHWPLSTRHVHIMFRLLSHIPLANKTKKCSSTFLQLIGIPKNQLCNLLQKHPKNLSSHHIKT